MIKSRSKKILRYGQTIHCDPLFIFTLFNAMKQVKIMLFFTSKRLQLPQGYGDIEARVRYSHGSGTRISGIALLGRTVGHDVFILFHEGRISRFPCVSQVGQFAAAARSSQKFHRK